MKLNEETFRGGWTQNGARTVLVVLFLLLARPGRAADFYVSPSGNDANSGARSEPFASLERARDAVRAQKRTEPDRDFSVLIHGGLYRLDHTVIFSLEDSSAKGHTITYAACPGEKPIFSSGVEIADWKMDGAFWSASLPVSMMPFRTLYDETGPLPRARGKAFSPRNDSSNRDRKGNYALAFPAGALKNWSNLADVDIVVRPNYGWILNVLPLESVDEKSGWARTSIPATYPMVRVVHAPAAINERGTVWVENVLDDLKEPGGWVLNTQSRKVYLLPRHKLIGTNSPTGIVAPQLTELLRIEGKIDYDGPQDQPVRGLVFRGLGFTHGDRLPWDRDHRRKNVQQDWAMFDQSTALVRLRGAENISFERCHWFDSGGDGLRMDLYAKSNRVADSVFEHLGGTGILLAGYGPGTKDVNRENEILRNHIHHVGEILWHAAGIAVWQSGENRVSHNLLHDLNYSGIVVSGRTGWDPTNSDGGGQTDRWAEIKRANPAAVPSADYFPAWAVREPFLHGRNNLIERNEIHDVMQKLWDGDGIYISGTGHSNWVFENFIHDCPSETMGEGIRCDDDQDETIIERNVIMRNGGLGTGITSKGKNWIINNFLINPNAVLKPRGLISLEAAAVKGSVIQRNILVTTATNLPPLFLQNTTDPSDPRPLALHVENNLLWNAGHPDWATTYLASAHVNGREKNTAIGDPLFRSPETGDFRFQDGSPAPALGIQPIDLRKVGLR